MNSLSQLRFLFIAFISLSLTLVSCDKRIRKEGSGVLQTVTRDLDYFSELEADGKFDITVHIDSVPHVTITTDHNILEDVQTFVQEGRLYIEMNNDYFHYSFTKMQLHVYAPECNEIHLNGNNDIEVADTLYNETLYVSNNGSGFAGILYNGDELTMKINGSGDMRAEGNVTEASYEVNGSGDIDALDMDAYNVSAHINGSGDINLNCTNYLDAEIDGSGSIHYTGNPTVNVDINGSGSVGPF